MPTTTSYSCSSNKKTEKEVDDRGMRLDAHHVPGSPHGGKSDAPAESLHERNTAKGDDSSDHARPSATTTAGRSISTVQWLIEESRSSSSSHCKTLLL